MLIYVMTAERHESLHRLLHSLDRANYPCAKVDLFINVDMSTLLLRTSAAMEVATQLTWKHGTKTVFRRLAHAGLSQSWFELPYQTDHDFIAVFEDDMEVNPNFYTAFSTILRHGVINREEITGFCLHPDDWEVNVHNDCESGEYSRYLYETPEPCNWGPIWKRSEWREYTDWVFKMKARGQLPYVEHSMGFNWNRYLDEGLDVQSPWVWRFHYDTGKRMVRYSMAACSGEKSDKLYLAINHKEPGEHFTMKFNDHTDQNLLSFSLREFLKELKTDKSAFNVRPFDENSYLHQLVRDM